MSTTPEKDTDKAFHIRTGGGTFVKGYDPEAVANASAADRNKEAERLGITARYLVTANG